MNNVRITAIRKASYPDLMAQYENPIEHTCDVQEGQSVSIWRWWSKMCMKLDEKWIRAHPPNTSWEML